MKSVEASRSPRLLQMMLSTQPGGVETFFEKLSLAFAEAGVWQCLVTEPDSARAALFAGYPHVEHVPVAFGGLGAWGARRSCACVYLSFAPSSGGYFLVSWRRFSR